MRREGFLNAVTFLCFLGVEKTGKWQERAGNEGQTVQQLNERLVDTAFA